MWMKPIGQVLQARAPGLHTKTSKDRMMATPRGFGLRRTGRRQVDIDTDIDADGACMLKKCVCVYIYI